MIIIVEGGTANWTLVCCACSVEGMSHCPYLLHKFVINYLFDIILCASFI